VLAGDSVPRINPFVDLYNAISLKHGLCAGADDRAKIVPPLAFRYSRPSDSFLDMGAGQGVPADDPPKSGEVVYADAEKVLCRRWNWRQDMRSAIAPTTRSAIVTIQANGAGDLERAIAEFTALLSRFFGATSRAKIVESSRPITEIP
jgi:DNA/RNA-binding domain of Phe-tRNA-synthetase-like protein